MPYADFQAESSPPWLRGEKGEAFQRAVGSCKDALADRTKRAVKARFPIDGTPADALSLIGSERGIDRLPTDTNETYALRLRAAWATRQWAGTPYGMLRALEDAGYAGAYLLIQNGVGYHLDAAGELVVTTLLAGSWNIDTDPDAWARFQVFFPLNHQWAVVPGSLVAGAIGDLRTHCYVGGEVGAGALDHFDVFVQFDVPNFVSVSKNGALQVDFACPSEGAVIDLGAMRAGLKLTVTSYPGGDQDMAFDVPALGYSAFASSDIPVIRAIVNKWRPAFSTCAGVVVHQAGKLFGVQVPPFDTLIFDDMPKLGAGASSVVAI